MVRMRVIAREKERKREDRESKSRSRSSSKSKSRSKSKRARQDKKDTHPFPPSAISARSLMMASSTS